MPVPGLMTATSGPGFSLMMENIWYAAMTEQHPVIVNVQRGGPSTGQPTMAAQGDMMQCRFNRTAIMQLSRSARERAGDVRPHGKGIQPRLEDPVLFSMADEVIGHMRECILVPDAVDHTCCLVLCPARRRLSRVPTLFQTFLSGKVTGRTSRVSRMTNGATLARRTPGCTPHCTATR